MSTDGCSGSGLVCCTLLEKTTQITHKEAPEACTGEAEPEYVVEACVVGEKVDDCVR